MRIRAGSTAQPAGVEAGVECKNDNDRCFVIVANAKT
jgi:hypothetical protein